LAAPRQNKEKVETQGPAPDPAASLAAAIEIFDDEFASLKIEGKIATISGYLGRIPKNGWNKFNEYAYVLESDLVEAIRAYLAAARILIYPSVKETNTHFFEPINGKMKDPLTSVLYTFHVVDGRTGERFELDALGQGSDPRDKGSNKASTSAMKFAYLRLFNISSGEEAEADTAGDKQDAQAPINVAVTQGTIPDGEVQRGGKQTKASGAQIKAVSNLSNTLSLGGIGLAGVIKKVLGDTVDVGDDETKHGPILAAYLKEKSGEDIGKLIYTLDEMVKALPSAEDGGGYGG